MNWQLNWDAELSAVHNVHSVKCVPLPFTKQSVTFIASEMHKERIWFLSHFVCLLPTQFPNFLQHSNWMNRIDRIDRSKMTAFCLSFDHYYFFHIFSITFEIYHQRIAWLTNTKQNKKRLLERVSNWIKHLNPHSNGMDGGEKYYVYWKSSIKYWISNFINKIILLPDWRGFSSIIIRSTLDTKRFNYCGISQFRKSKDLNETK